MSPSPHLSQVLLDDTSWIRRCISCVDQTQFGVEWGCGRGALTEYLVKKWDYTLGLELDPDFCSLLRHSYSPENIGLIRTDILQYPLDMPLPAYPLVGNLPYHITGPLLMKILENSEYITRFQGLVQWEVAERLASEPGESSYRGISVLFNWIGSIEVQFRVPSEAFEPVPEVDSGWIEFEPERSRKDIRRAKSFVQLCFAHPRKTLLNNLAAAGPNKEFWKNWMRERDWNIMRRPSTLDPEDFGEVFKTWSNTVS